MKYLNQIATAFCVAALGLMTLTSCEGGDLYSIDSPENLLPSLHCYISWLCWIGTRKNSHIPKWYQYTSLAIAVAICISTLTVKQHVFADLVTGVLLAELSYLAAGCCGRFLKSRQNGRKENI